MLSVKVQLTQSMCAFMMPQTFRNYLIKIVRNTYLCRKKTFFIIINKLNFKYLKQAKDIGVDM